MRRTMVVALAGLLVIGVACGGGDDDREGGVSATAESEPTAGPTLDASLGPTLTLVADELEFDQDELSAPAGVVTVLLINDDIGQPHDVSVHRGDSADGERVGKTDIDAGPAESQVTMLLEPGEYYFWCSVHPDMSGRLVVE